MGAFQAIFFALLCLTGIATADVTIITGAEPKPWRGGPAITSVDQLFRTSLETEFYNNSAKILLTSYDERKITKDDGIRPSADSFVRGAIQAWGEHQHLVIRPEEVWFTILVQMNFFMNKHAEDVRKLFVDFNGQQVIHVEDYTWYKILMHFKDEIQKRVKTDWLLDWIMPSFTTTTESDIMTANILMMSLTQAYFKFEGFIICGLPSVTLLGTQADWQKLLAKLDHLADFGAEPKAYSARLRPILTRFVSSFAKPDAPETLAFWNQIASAQSSNLCGAPPYYLSGWITGFLFWNTKGEAYGQDSTGGNLTLDGVSYPRLGITTLPIGYAKAPFKMIDYPEPGQNFSAYVLAGTLAKQVTAGPPAGYADAVKRAGNASLQAGVSSTSHSTLKPLSGWLLFGPVDYNATVEWQGDRELTNLTQAISRNFNADQCAMHTFGAMS